MSVKYVELQDLDHDELAGRLRTSRRELYELRFKLAVGQLENHREIRAVRKDIARIMTALRSQELMAAPSAGGPARARRAEPAAPKAAPGAEAETGSAPEAAAEPEIDSGKEK